MFHHMGPLEIGIILVIILIIFGVGKLPQVGGAIGKGLHEFRKATRGEQAGEKDQELKTRTESSDKAADS